MEKIANVDWTHFGDVPSKWHEEYFLKKGTRKIIDIKKPCSHPEHKPPSYYIFEPGVYEHICPECGKRNIFIVNGIYT